MPAALFEERLVWKSSPAVAAVGAAVGVAMSAERMWLGGAWQTGHVSVASGFPAAVCLSSWWFSLSLC